ncbi:MAG: CueP family metal-binding protein [Candidatus Hodarchaeales archaeon]
MAIYAGFFIFPSLNQDQDGPNINYIAPYVNNTHTCYTHVQGCTAELPNQLINYTVWSNDNSINITSSAITGANGFFKLDLERDYNWTIQMQTNINNNLYQGMTNFSTFSGSANCITTGQLKF